jgi:hypothetical protein
MVSSREQDPLTVTGPTGEHEGESFDDATSGALECTGITSDLGRLVHGGRS